MPFGPILAREFTLASRRRATYERRAGVAAMILLAVGGCYLTAFIWKGELLTPREVSLFARAVFALLMVVQLILIIGLVPDHVGRSIAEEKEKRTLGDLLTTRVNASEVILGSLAAHLLRCASWLAVGLPIVALLPLLGGIDPRLVLWAYAATASTAFALGGISILASVLGRHAREGVGLAMMIAMAWLVLPFPAFILVPRAWPWLGRQLGPLLQWAVVSGPFGILGNFSGLISRGTIVEQVAGMIAIQLGIGAACAALAVALLRPVYRGQIGGDTRILGVARPRRWRLPRRIFPRPACGDRPMLWKELHVASASLALRFVGLLVSLSVGGLIGYLALLLAGRAWFESVEAARVGPALASTTARDGFNAFLRGIGLLGSSAYLLMVAGFASEGIPTERRRETWTALLSTPLGGDEILRAKRLGAIWRVGWIPVGLALLWLLGVAVGSVHPVGFAAGLVVAGVSIWFAAALGGYHSLFSADAKQANNRTILPLLLMMLSGLLPAYIPERYNSILFGSASPSLVTYMVLLTPTQFHKLAWANASYLKDALSVKSGETATRVVLMLATWLVGTASAALWLTRAASRRFDEAVGRPTRPAPRPWRRPRSADRGTTAPRPEPSDYREPILSGAPSHSPASVSHSHLQF